MPLANGPKAFAPETAIGTGAAFPLTSEYDAAVATPSVDESTLGVSKKSKNFPGDRTETVKPSGEDIGDSGTGEVLSTGQEREVRDGNNLNVLANDPDVNKVASTVRPAEPQATKRPKPTT